MPIALITGGGKRRIGQHVAEALAARGYAIALHYRTSLQAAEESVAELQRRGAEAAAIGADLTDEAAVQKLVQATLRRFGRIDALINCAAIWERKPLEQIVAADLRRHFEVNTLATFLCAQQVGLAMVAQPEGGAIVNFGDWAEVRPYLDYAAYFPSKGAVTTMTRSLAVELAHRNPRVRVNCILPGPVMLPLDLPAAERREAIAGTLVQREGSPQNVAQAVLHFLENDFVTGVCLPIDGGRSIYAHP
ncbi:MAG TPA: SDR family oxidoreductase [Pirellulales bacterium]|jgi:pteridine reductase|nr:SDR family oxidoreductase [Pirellulales bacterium]